MEYLSFKMSIHWANQSGNIHTIQARADIFSPHYVTLIYLTFNNCKNGFVAYIFSVLWTRPLIPIRNDPFSSLIASPSLLFPLIPFSHRTFCSHFASFCLRPSFPCLAFSHFHHSSILHLLYTLVSSSLLPVVSVASSRLLSASFKARLGRPDHISG